MSFTDDLAREPGAHDFYAVLRRLERNGKPKPLIGESGSARDDIVKVGQDPFLAFPDSNLSGAATGRYGQQNIKVKFLGFFGPQGPLPLAITEEFYGYSRLPDSRTRRHESFPRFLDLLSNRFVQLFFRGWASARPIVHADRPESDRFQDYVGSQIGIGSALMRDLDRDTIPDFAKLGFAGLMAPSAKSASRLRDLIHGIFGVEVEVEQFVGSWLPLNPDDCTFIGRGHCGLGVDTLLGSRIYSVQDKFRIRLHARDAAQYDSFLPMGGEADALADLVFFYIGEELDWDVEVTIPCSDASGMRLGQSGRLGWTSWVSPNWAVEPGARRSDARLHLAERVARKRRASRRRTGEPPMQKA